MKKQPVLKVKKSMYFLPIFTGSDIRQKNHISDKDAPLINKGKCLWKAVIQ